MTTYDLQHLLATVEAVREELHPEVPAALLEAVVEAEDANPDADDAALRAIEAAVSEYVGVTVESDS